MILVHVSMLTGVKVAISLPCPEQIYEPHGAWITGVNLANPIWLPRTNSRAPWGVDSWSETGKFHLARPMGPGSLE